jgi:polysaccharide export outer membrane protein
VILEKIVMSYKIGHLLVVSAILLAGPATLAQFSEELGEEGASAEIFIELPEGSDSDITVVPEDNDVIVELPRGSVFPLEFASSSSGLLRGGQVVPLGGDRVQLRLDMALGLLDRIVYRPGGLALIFKSKFDVKSAAQSADEQYLLGPDDKLIITVHNHPELTSELTISREGIITVPLLGDVRAEGYSPRQFGIRLSELLGRSYLVDPQVDVEVAEYRSQWVMVTGEVRIPSRISLRGGTRLKEVLAEAGGFGVNSGELITISRRVEGSGDYTTIKVNRSEFEIGGSDPVLRHGDIIDVGRSAWCYCQGEVRSPGRTRIERGMTLLKAISLCGGLTEWADRKQVRMLTGEGSERHELIFNLKRIVEGKNEDPVLTGGEVIVVDRRFF